MYSAVKRHGSELGSGCTRHDNDVPLQLQLFKFQMQVAAMAAAHPVIRNWAKGLAIKPVVSPSHPT